MVVVGQQRSIEDYVNDAIGSLQQSLPAALAAQTARYSAADVAAGIEVKLPVPRPEDYYPGGATVHVRYPAIEISVPDLLVQNFSLHQEDADTQFTMIVLGYDQHARLEILYRKMMRLGAALYDALAQPGALGSAVIDNFRGAWRFNPETNTLDEIVSGVLLVFRMKDAYLRP